MQPANNLASQPPIKFAPFVAGEDKIGKNTVICLVSDNGLANALISVGIPLRRDPPYVFVERKDGSQGWTFNFYPSTEDGRVTVRECTEAWRGDLEWLKKNPNHPFAYAMLATKNMVVMLEHQRKAVPYVAFRVPQERGPAATLLVKKGSKKHEAAVKKGYRQV